MPSNFPAEGQCLCGAVRVTAHAAPWRMAICHCRDCQRSTGTGHATNALFKEGDVSVQGDTKSHAVTADSGNTLTRHFCPTCGARVFGRNSGRPGLVIVPVGLFEDSSWYAPHAALYAKRRQSWDVMQFEDIPCYDAMPPAPPTAP